MIRVVLPPHLRTLARVDGELELEVKTPLTQGSVVDALEANAVAVDCSPMEVDPRTSAKTTPMSISMPPAGRWSKQYWHRLGFFRDGFLPIAPKTFPPMPANGLRQSLQRGSCGKWRKTRCACFRGS